jgi:hypothetical protein
MTKQITDQELFDECATHVIQQGKKAESSYGCVYRTDDGCGCALGGPLANHGLYTPELDAGDTSVGVASLTSNKLADSEGLKLAMLGMALADSEGLKLAMLGMALAAWGVQKRQLQLLEDIQNAHDRQRRGPHFVQEFKHKMRLVATDHGLNAAVLA